ncbi:MAG TPA: ABC transporter substrate-binding protein [Myxococcales bacterium]|nr:ABC transporter substrate-binding protein [Myxococcales bacterium]
MRRLVVLLLLLGCSSQPKAKTITLGAVLSQTGELADIGAGELQAANLAVSQINAAGGVLGAQLALDAKDDHSEADAGVAAAQALVSAGVPVILGAVASGVTIPIAQQVAIPAGVVLISGASTSPAYTALHADGGWTFRTCPSDALQGKLLAERASAKGFTKVAALYDPGAYGSGLAAAFQQGFADAGTVAYFQPFAEGETDYTAQLGALFATSPQGVLLVAYPEDGTTILKDYLASYSGQPVFWFFTDSLDDPGFIAGLGASSFTFAHEGTTPATPDGGAYDAFAAAFQSQVGGPPPEWSANLYDAVYLVALAMTAAGQSDAASVASHLVAVSGGPGTAVGPSSYARAVEALQSGQGINYGGASGPVDFDAAGDVVGPYDIWHVQDGGVAIVEHSVSP